MNEPTEILTGSSLSQENHLLIEESVNKQGHIVEQPTVLTDSLSLENQLPKEFKIKPCDPRFVLEPTEDLKESVSSSKENQFQFASC